MQENLIELIDQILPGLIVFAIGQTFLQVILNKDKIVEIFESINKFSHINGEWHQYHYSRDKQVNPRKSIWIHHIDTFKINWLLKVKGKGVNSHSTKLDYKISGKISDDKLFMKYSNKTSKETPVNIVIENLLSKDLLQGVWIGYDFNKDFSIGPIIYSRKEKTEEELSTILRRYDINILK
ncbi:hypothetical protein [uncultured Algibacter sp.]|uniref:hypothetical protein n=1 Tax=uncultured Algibacter sp. TaxID=298659 RepID=UPI002612E4C3|nr:hypothetical protein [uncultured Algibacter sp.]